MELNILAITQARAGSSRLPGKVLKDIKGKTLLQIHVDRIKKSKKISNIILATTISEKDDKIVTIGQALNIKTFRGDENNVLDRFYKAATLQRSPDFIVRLTSDCPLIDPVLIDKVISYTIDNQLDYCSNTLNPTYPDGQDIEVFKFSALEKAYTDALQDSEKEHVTPYIWKNSTFKGKELFISDNFDEGFNFGHIRMTVDEQLDFDLIKMLIEDYGTDLSWLEYSNIIQNQTDKYSINQAIKRNEGYSNSIEKEK